ncbi:sigma-70 family RNA polymerase sigma factor [Pannonibacter sp. Pt2-lr]|uniref:RNA polymerase sigma factor n=1 Tax=Pannonibacter anstelovis TaxID=3121537 RepID=A0ABU7ZMD6_9HYPH
MTDWMTIAGAESAGTPSWGGRAPGQTCKQDIIQLKPDGRRPRSTAAGQRCGEEVVSYIPALRIFARSLCRNPVEADDLVQETLLRAIERANQFEPGTNLRAWLFTIMRNRFYSNWAKRSRERTGDQDCVSGEPIGVADTQIWHLRMREMEEALHQLPIHYRETIILVAVLGESYIHASQILGCDIGTIKSRVNRARAALRDKLDEV